MAFRRQVLELLEKGYTVAEVARIAKVGATSVHAWRKDAYYQRMSEKQDTAELQEEIKRLLKERKALEEECAALRLENELLKKDDPTFPS